MSQIDGSLAREGRGGHRRRAACMQVRRKTIASSASTAIRQVLQQRRGCVFADHRRGVSVRFHIRRRLRGGKNYLRGGSRWARTRSGCFAPRAPPGRVAGSRKKLKLRGGGGPPVLLALRLSGVREFYRRNPRGAAIRPVRMSHRHLPDRPGQKAMPPGGQSGQPGDGAMGTWQVYAIW